MESVSACYRIDVIGTGKFYIGSTSDFLQRMAAHKSSLKAREVGKTNPLLQKLFDQGFELNFSILDTGTRDEMYDVEKKLIDFHKDDKNLLNINLETRGGLTLSRHPNQESIRVKKSKAVLGENNPMHGKNHSIKAKGLIAQAAKGNKRWLGKKHTDDSKQKISEHAKTRTGERNSFFGKTHSDEFKLALGDRKRGTKPTNTNVISIDGVEYLSQADAAKALGVSIGTISFRLKSNNPKFSGYAVVRQGAV